MKNLLILHLESITRHRLAAFGSAFPNTQRLMRDSLVFDNFFSSATSTLMVVTYLFHGNDFEFDASSQFEGMRPAANNPHLFSVLRSRGYHADIVCLSGFHGENPMRLAAWADDLPPAWSTNNFATLSARFEELTATPPFAIYVWDLVTHIEHSFALAPFASGLTDQIRRACAVADDVIGTMLATLERKGLLDNTTIVVYGDHGDDYWTHGFKGGMVHATEPYTQMTWTPMAIRDPVLLNGTSENLASTIDIAPTCRALLGVDEPDRFPYSGTNLLTGAPKFVFSQNFTANQPDNRELGIVKAYAATDDTYNLVASSRGLELYAYRLDPGNHCNLLHFFDVFPDGRIALREGTAGAAHFRAALKENVHAVAHLASHFGALRAALAERVAAKRAYVVESGVAPAFTLEPRYLHSVGDQGREAFFQGTDTAQSAAAMPPFAFSFTLR